MNNRFRSPRTPMCRLALALAPLFATLPAAVIAAPPGANLHHYDIPAGSLDQVLNRYAAESGAMLTIDSTLTAGRSSDGLRGDYSLKAGFAAILARDGLVAVPDGPESGAGGYILRKAGADAASSADSSVVLPPVKIESAGDHEALRVNPPTTVGSKTPLTQREIAQTVTVVPQEQIEQQNMKTLDDAMRYVPGVSVAQDDSERTSYYSRGFPINTWLLDGVATMQNLSSSSANLAMFERVEVLQGPDALMSGFGSEGGALNMVRKRAPSTYSVNAELFGGSYRDVGAMLDVGGSLNQSGTLRGRVVGSFQNQGLVWDDSWRHDKLLYGTLEYDFSPDTRLRVGASFSETDQKAGWTGTVSYDTPIDGVYQQIGSRSTYFGPSWNDNAYYDTTAFAELEHKLGAGWSAKVAFNYLGSRDSILNMGASGAVNGTDLFDVMANKWHQADDQESVDTFISGPLHLLGRTHTLTFGASYQRETFNRLNNYCGLNDSSDGGNWCSEELTLPQLQNAAQPAFNGPVSAGSSVTNQYGLYGNTRISLADPLTLVLGGRLTWWNTASYDEPDHVRTSADQDQGKFTPYAALIYDLGNTWSVYTSYSRIFNPQSATDALGNVLPPLEGVQYEAGIKGEHFGGRLNTSLAIFQLTEKNRALSDPRFPDEGFYYAAGQARSRGVEVTATGHVTPNWSVFGGYTYTDAQYLDASAAPTYANGVGTTGFSSIAPRNLFKLWTDYRLGGTLRGFSVGGGAYFSSGLWATDGSGGYLRQGSFATFDLRGAYQITKQLSAALSVTNLFDRHYLASVENAYGGFYGQPRRVVFTLRYKL